MKKMFLIISAVLLLTGCGNKLTCTEKGNEEDFDYERKIVFTIGKNDIVKSSVIDYTMTFEDTEDASNNYNFYLTLDEDYDIKLSGKRVIIRSYQDYSDYNQSKVELKSELEKNGYTCK